MFDSDLSTLEEEHSLLCEHGGCQAIAPGCAIPGIIPLKSRTLDTETGGPSVYSTLLIQQELEPQLESPHFLL